MTKTARSLKKTSRARMTGQQRREQLIDVGRRLFAERGVEGTSVEEIAQVAAVSKPLVYEHFGGKEGLYAVIVDREIASLAHGLETALTAPGSSRQIIERAAIAMLDYIEGSTDGFRILMRDSPPGADSGTLANLVSDVTTQVEHIMVAAFTRKALDPKAAPLYAQALVGMVSLTGQWWLGHPTMQKDEVAAHLVNLAWNGLTALDPAPTIETEHLDPEQSDPARD